MEVRFKFGSIRNDFAQSFRIERRLPSSYLLLFKDVKNIRRPYLARAFALLSQIHSMASHCLEDNNNSGTNIEILNKSVPRGSDCRCMRRLIVISGPSKSRRRRSQKENLPLLCSSSLTRTLISQSKRMPPSGMLTRRSKNVWLNSGQVQPFLCHSYFPIG